MPTQPTPPLVSRAEWLGSRAALAGQRSARFAVTTTGLFVVALGAVFLVPVLTRSRAADPLVLDLAPDTTALLRLAGEARQRLARADSLLEVAASGFNGAPLGAAVELTSVQRQSRDSLRMLATSLDELLDRATKAPLSASFHALAAATALRGDARTKALNDSLDALERRRAALGPTTGAERAAAKITDQVNDVGAMIRAVATRRQSRLARDIAQFGTTIGTPAAIDTLSLRAARDSARLAVQRAESTVLAAHVFDVRSQASDTPGEAPSNRRVPPVALLVAMLVLVLFGGFGWNLASEVRRPTIGGAREAERAAGAPVIAIARPPALTRGSGGIDPFRMVYLALTATGTKMRTVTITGDDRGVVGTVAARLALAAAGDARATLIVDTDAEGSSLGGYYHLVPEPGFTDAVAGVHLWRDVTRSIGANEGLSIDVVVGGSIRRDEPDETTLAAARTEFTRVRGEYDFCVVVAPTRVALQRLAALVDTPITVLCAEVGSTPVAWMVAEAAQAKATGAVLHGLVLWDGSVPKLRTRSEQVLSGFRTGASGEQSREA
jgi:Mrp family chromosome partitioning ATPase